ncbi:MAG: ribulokinase [Opitutus sp.]|nr:ribulokinase [Opitutus sp.]
MAIVAGIDFGTQSVRVSLVDSQRGRVGGASAAYPVLRVAGNPDHATQRHSDHVTALVQAMRAALASAGIDGHEIAALAVDSTGSTVMPVDASLAPLGDYYLWCDHRAAKEAAEITAVARARNLEALRWYGGVYSSEMAWAKVLHWLRHNPGERTHFATAVEHCDFIVAMLCGVERVEDLPRSVCAAGHKWLWQEATGGLPDEEFFCAVDPLLAGVRERFGTHFGASDRLAGRLCTEWAEKLGLRASLPIPFAGLDAHWDAIGSGIADGDIVNVVGTSTCVMAVVRDTQPIEGIFGIVPGSVHPARFGIEAGMSAAGDIFEAIARRAGTTVAALAEGLEHYQAGQTGLLRLTWDHGDRNVLSNPTLSGVTLGWRLSHEARDELFAAMEGTAFHTRIILERLEENGVEVRRVINGGGISRRSKVLNQVFANVLNKPVLVPETDVTSLGSAIFALLAAGAYSSVEAAQKALCPRYHIYDPECSSVIRYEALFALYRRLYFGWGADRASPLHLLDELTRRITF